MVTQLTRLAHPLARRLPQALRPTLPSLAALLAAAWVQVGQALLL